MANQPINSDQIVYKPEVVLDPNFGIPKGLARVSNSEPGTSDADNSSDLSGDDTSTLDSTTSILGDTGDVEFPQTGNIFTQKLKFQPNGSTLVDVYIDAEDVAGATNYEIRVTKA